MKKGYIFWLTPQWNRLKLDQVHLRVDLDRTFPLQVLFLCTLTIPVCWGHFESSSCRNIHLLADSFIVVTIYSSQRFDVFRTIVTMRLRIHWSKFDVSETEPICGIVSRTGKLSHLCLRYHIKLSTSWVDIFLNRIPVVLLFALVGRDRIGFKKCLIYMANIMKNVHTKKVKK